ncbi:molecular chaperone HtpG [Legionella sp. W05-934-2]|uniref:molecular chaperone HtpG n=1 Tax=Legionella sp. W05-934-2 TaxID=1198649 RepID=UPI0034630ADC
MTKQTMGFQTEVKQMLNLVIHSLYSNKEIFLRELISNASDALDKLRFLALSNSELYENDSDLKITLEVDEKKKQIVIRDNGIGMSKEETIANLGTLAKSGTKEFLSHLSGDQAKDSHLIGQFGVGFYSAFIVADKVTVHTRKAGVSAKEGVVWQSSGDGEFTVDDKTLSHRGTEIILHLKKDEDEFLSDYRLRSIINKYSDHVCWPIQMKKMDDEGKESDDFETINKATALWTLSKSEISSEQYEEFYKSISHDYQTPLTWTHNHVEGKHDYISLLYIPSSAPYDLWQHEAKHGLKLYVKRVFIMDDVNQFLPRYLRFVKGIIDASDLPLNVSREILQDNKQVDAIRSACTKRVLSMLEKLSKQEDDKYQKFWKEFGLVLKEGPIEDYSNKEEIAKLLRFASTHNADDQQTVSLTDYVSRMKEGQDQIYYITASSYNAAKNSPHLEIFRKKEIEVLLLSDKVDEWLVSYLSEFDEKPLKSIAKGDVKLDNNEEEQAAIKEKEKSFESMLSQIQTILGEKVKSVKLSNRLTDSPACVVADDQDMGLEMQRILQAAGQQLPATKPVLEINPDHSLIKNLHAVTDDEKFKEWVYLLFDQALLAEGGQLDNPGEFVRRMNRMLVGGCVD